MRVTARFDLAVPGDVRFGAGRVADVPAVLSGLGVTSALLVTGSRPDRVDGVRSGIESAGIGVEVLAVRGEPTIEVVRRGLTAAVGADCDGVVGVGGGSVLDTAKAVAALGVSRSDPLDHLEVVGAGLPLTGPGLPCVAVPTTAGTGSEVTRNAVLAVGDTKASLRGPLLLPRVALVDPDLLVGVPRATIASSGLDALTQLIEPYLSIRANPMTDAWARDGIIRSARSLRRAWAEGLDDDSALRDDLALASLLGGLCLANAGLGAVHGFASALGARLGAPHGATCAALLAATFESNLTALRDRDAGNPSLAKADDVAQLLTGDPGATGDDAVVWLADLVAVFDIPGLASYGATEVDLPELAAAGRRASSMRANPIELSDPELVTILRRSM